MPATNENTKQIKSRQRVAEHGEVFTNPREVNAMLDLVRDESFRLDSRFLEPACGDGNFLIEILRRKLSLLQSVKSSVKGVRSTSVAFSYKGVRSTSVAFSQTEWEFKSLIAVGSCYGIDILPDNAEACRERLYQFVLNTRPHSLHTPSPLRGTPPNLGGESSYIKSLKYMLQKNIVCGDALTYRTAEGKPITFCEWTPIAGSMQFARRDFQFDFLVTQSHQYSLFDEQGQVQSFDEPIRTYPPLHYTQLYRYEEQL